MSDTRSRRPEWWPVARFEFLRVVRRGDFLVSLVLMPLLSVGLSFGAGWIANRAANEPVKLAFSSAAPGIDVKLPALDTLKTVHWTVVAGAQADPQRSRRRSRRRPMTARFSCPPASPPATRSAC